MTFYRHVPGICNVVFQVYPYKSRGLYADRIKAEVGTVIHINADILDRNNLIAGFV